MSKLQAKIDGNLINIDGFLSDTNKTYYAEPIKDGEIEGLSNIGMYVMRDRLIELLKTPHKADLLRQMGYDISKYEDDCVEAMIADLLLANGVIVPPCKVGTTVYEIEPKWYGIWGEDEHECRGCEHFYEGGMGDPSECSLGKNCCYQICEKEANLRSLADWIIPSSFTKEIAWGKTVFLTREEAEKALKEREGEG